MQMSRFAHWRALWNLSMNDGDAAKAAAALNFLKLVCYYNPGPDYMKTQRYYLWALYEREVIPALCRMADGGTMDPEITEYGEWEENMFRADPSLREAWADYRNGRYHIEVGRCLPHADALGLNLANVLKEALAKSKRRRRST